MMDKPFQWGDKVRIVSRIYNDGSFLGAPRGQLLVQKGDIGEVRGHGLFLQTQRIYAVFFPVYGYEVGVRERELIAADAPWQDSQFEFRQWVKTRCAMSVNGELRVDYGCRGQIFKVVRDKTPVHYQVNFGDDKLYLIGESLLEADHD
ncbi:MAG: hypothetical protein CENE_02810 [Candidatus Celerinatantimonas neptuna]|nr:MAG: hypothetical protein CENE_02810 [Candidatus Celerinatantimonas neptuna]